MFMPKYPINPNHLPLKNTIKEEQLCPIQLVQFYWNNQIVIATSWEFELEKRPGLDPKTWDCRFQIKSIIAQVIETGHHGQTLGQD